MIVAAAIADLGVLPLIDARADGRRCPKIERSAGDGRDLTGRDESRVHGRHRVGVDRERVAEYVTRSITSKIPVAVLREIDRRRLVAHRLIVHDQPIVIREGVSDCSTKSPWITLFHVRARVIERDTNALVISERLCVPDNLVKPAKSTVQTIWTVVDGEAVGGSVERESPTRNPVAVAPDDRAEVWAIMEISTQAVVAEDDVIEPPRAVRRLERGDDSAVVGEPHLDAMTVRESE